MALTGCCLVLFVTFHVLMNAVAMIWPTAYNQVCEFLGANWYALIASAGLALLFIIHIIYAVWLTIQNRAARGNDRYAVTSRPKQVEWSSKNMLVLGIVVVAFLVVHMIQFWSKMQLQEMIHTDLAALPQLDGAPCAPAMGTLFLQMAFSQIWTPIVYIIGFVALWFHMNHGFWSMFHTVGWDNNVWIERFKKIACWWSSIVVALFIAQAVVFTIQAKNNYYTENEAIQEQYSEFWNDKASEVVAGFQAELAGIQQVSMTDPAGAQKAAEEFFAGPASTYKVQAEAIFNAFSKQCTKVAAPENVTMCDRLVKYVEYQQQMASMQQHATPQNANH
jgi:succinate dehydrogenase / fumarate reductase cytochrome b subunit